MGRPGARPLWRPSDAAEAYRLVLSHFASRSIDAQLALADYREVPALEEALYIMYLSYDKLGMNDLRDDAQRVLTTNYPQSTYLANGFKGSNDPWWKLW